MIDFKNKKIFFLKALGGVIAIVAAAFLFSFLIISVAGNFNGEQTLFPEQSSEAGNAFSVYVVSGKIIDIQDKTVFLETPIFDSTKNKWNENKKETRKLTIDDKAELLRLFYKSKEGKNELELYSDKIQFADIKIGDNVQANFSEDLVKIRDFTPTIITILPK